MVQPNIKVEILTAKEIRFDLFGEFIIFRNESKYSGRFKAKLIRNQISLIKDNQEIISGTEITLSPRDFDTDSFMLRDVIIGKNFHWQKKENQRFRGKLHLIQEGNEITAINILPLEEYLTSVISSEMSPNSSIELLKAHAIVSRSWLLAQLAKSHIKTTVEIENESELIKWYDRDDHKNYDFCADDHCQRYQGITKVINDHAIHAIMETRGLVLYHNNSICDTRYSKCCGGKTETFENVWENVKHDYLSSIMDYKFELDGFEPNLTKEINAENWILNSPNSFCNTNNTRILSQVLVDFDRETNDFYRWKVEYSQEEIAAIIHKKIGIDFGVIKDLVPISRGESGRITKLKIIGEKKSLTIGKELEIRRTLSDSHLYSSAFVVKTENLDKGIPQKFIINGAGWGHGVGLCQIGAAVMGEMGYGFDEILQHYFFGAKIQKGY